MRAAQDFDNFYQTRHYSVDQNQTTESVLVVSVDGKGIVMRTQDLKEKTRKAAEARTFPNHPCTLTRHHRCKRILYQPACEDGNQPATRVNLLTP